MRHTILTTLLLCALGCTPAGKLDGECNWDGTCDSPKLECVSTANGHYCHLKPEPENPPRRCHYESECFCVTCADKCGAAGVKACHWSDTTTWGAKPAVCDCK